jgi:HlyD family secretion protein
VFFAQKLAFAEKTIPVDVVVLTRGDVERTVASVSAGRVASRRRARVAAPIVGRIVSIAKRKGERVEKDEVVLELDASEARANLAQAASAVEAAKASVQESEASILMARNGRDAYRASIDDTQARLEIARDLHERMKRSGAASSAQQVAQAEKEVTAWQSQLEANRAHFAEAEAKIASIEAQLGEARARVAESEAHVAQARAFLDKHTIRAPFAGVLSELWVELGEVTMIAGAMPMGKNPGQESAGAKLFEVIDTSDLYVTAPIDEVDLARVHEGQEARVNLDPWPHEPFVGKVIRVAPYVLDVEDQNRTVEIEVSIPPEWLARELKTGTSADVEVIVERKPSVPRLPANVLLDGRRCLVISTVNPGELRAEERELDIGIDNWRFAEIKSGLPLGAQVIESAVTGVHVKPGEKVSIRRTLDTPDAPSH